LPIRNPILAAEEVAVLDRLSGGRVILGIGRGFQASMFKPFGIPTSEKRKLFKSNLELMITAWKGEPIDEFEGTDITLSPLPVQQPHPPLWVAAFGPLAIKQAGTLGLPYIASPVETLSSLKENILAHQGHVRDTGHPPVTITPVMRTVFVTDNPVLEKQVRKSLGAEVASRFRDTATGVDEWAIVGDSIAIKDKLAQYEETLGLNYLIARGRIQGVDNDDQVRSHELLLKAAG
jgi:alkanesulfonate monooxygenase SsuD/methylene tetrahydromethanopterin reductase-like flavin-dependent oxidoreductase (luciferase family)